MLLMVESQESRSTVKVKSQISRGFLAPINAQDIGEYRFMDQQVRMILNRGGRRPMQMAEGCLIRVCFWEANPKSFLTGTSSLCYLPSHSTGAVTFTLSLAALLHVGNIFFSVAGFSASQRKVKIMLLTRVSWSKIFPREEKVIINIGALGNVA